MSMTLKLRLLLGFGSLMAILVAIGLFGGWKLRNSYSYTEEIAKNWLPSVKQIAFVNMNLSDFRVSELEYIAAEDEAHKAEAVASNTATRILLDKNRGIYESLISSPEERATYEQFCTQWDSFQRKHEELTTFAKDGKHAEAKGLLLGDANTAYDAATALLNKLTDMNVAGSDSSTAAAQANYTGSRAALMGIVIGGSVLGVALSLLVIRSITRPLGQVVAALNTVAGKDLTRPPLNITVKDEIGALARSTDTMGSSLREMIGQVQGTTAAVAAAATQIAASAEEMSAAVGEVAQQSARASQTADNSGRLAKDGGVIVGQTVDRMRQIERAVTESAASVTELGRRGEEIGQIVAVINDIADQTNLLALNAAIEAARAGEHGRGFAVVADEVRKLADRTTKATEQIGVSIKAIQDETSTAVSRMNHGTEEVRAGVESAGKAGSSLEEIVGGASDVASMINSISAASEEAGAGSSQSASAAHELSKKAEELRELVSQFKV